MAGRYVIAADGARSAVRRSLGVEFDGFTYPELFLIASTDFRFEDTLTDIAYVNYIADPLEWLVLLKVPGLWRVLVCGALCGLGVIAHARDCFRYCEQGL